MRSASERYPARRNPAAYLGRPSEESQVASGTSCLGFATSPGEVAGFETNEDGGDGGGDGGGEGISVSSGDAMLLEAGTVEVASRQRLT